MCYKYLLINPVISTIFIAFIIIAFSNYMLNLNLLYYIVILELSWNVILFINFEIIEMTLSNNSTG